MQVNFWTVLAVIVAVGSAAYLVLGGGSTCNT